ncbi:MAG: DUF2358 domain-containing protein [Pseudanabaenaceae cyanobacterium]
MDLLEIIKQDYARFPQAQTYSIYAPDVHFRDPVYNFRGIDRYKDMIKFITTWFRDLQLELHSIERVGDTIQTTWTMRWRAPLPWRPPISVSGWTELKLNREGKICAHYDYWHCSKWDVIKQHFRYN